MPRLIATLLAGLAMAIVPHGAVAQNSPNVVVGPVVLPAGPELDDLHDTIKDARDAGQITRREARKREREAWVLQSAASRYAQDGFSAAERREIQTQAIIARQQVDAQRGVVFHDVPARGD